MSEIVVIGIMLHFLSCDYFFVGALIYIKKSNAPSDMVGPDHA